MTASVDRVIRLPEGWLERSRARRLRYFIPDWDDQVDPGYDFATDTHSGGRGRWSNQVYAHQLYPAPCYDGLLVSKVVTERPRRKREALARLGVHRYLRVPREVPVMGDCGAFGYLRQEEPPYTTGEILDYYTDLGFDLGVSVDHLVVGGEEAERRRRWELTLDNARDFLAEHRARGLPWEPVGAVQGWDPASYAEAARRTAAMGYRVLGLGGLVRTRNPGVLATLEAVRERIPSGTDLHLFGLARLDAVARFADLGVTSCDSSSYLRQAWMRTRTSYVTGDDAFAALRIPQARPHFVRKRLESHPGLTAERLRVLEAEALRAVRAFDRGRAPVDTTLDALLAYDRYVTADRVDLSGPYRRTLEARPWASCPCAVCREAGVEVAIFRGNNRNRRRGFHNTWVFYRKLSRALGAPEP